MPMTDATLTVIVVSWNSRPTIERCLLSLAAQDSPGFQIALVDSGTDGAAEFVRRTFPWVNVISLAERKYPGDARNIGCRSATTDLIAFLDSDCIADPAWARSILEAHRSCADPFIGGSVGLALPAGPVSTATYFTEFSIWMPRTGSRTNLPHIPTCCWSMKRGAWERFGPFVEGTYCADTELSWRATAAGCAPLFDPAIRVEHIGQTNFFRFLRKFGMHGRAFGRLRVRRAGFREILVRALAMPVFPPILVARILQRECRFRYRPARFLAALPLTLMGVCAWCVGEGAAYWEALLSSKRRARRA